MSMLTTAKLHHQDAKGSLYKAIVQWQWATARLKVDHIQCEIFTPFLPTHMPYPLQVNKTPGTMYKLRIYDVLTLH